MTIDYPNNGIDGTSVTCNIHFENTAFNCNKLKDKYYLNIFIAELTKKLNLTPLHETLVAVHFKEEKPVGEGVTGTMILKTSHVCYHTWSEECYMRLELSVCKEINGAEVVAFIYEYFEIRNLKFVTHEEKKW